MHKTISQVIKAFSNLKNKVIEWPNKDKKRKESMDIIIKNDFSFV